MPNIVNRIVIGDPGQDPGSSQAMSAMSTSHTADTAAAHVAPDLLTQAAAILPAVSIDSHDTSGDWILG